MKKEGEQGSIAKRWSRRTGRNVGGRIEFRGVRQVYPVGGKLPSTILLRNPTRGKGAIE